MPLDHVRRAPLEPRQQVVRSMAGTRRCAALALHLVSSAPRLVDAGRPAPGRSRGCLVGAGHDRRRLDGQQAVDVAGHQHRLLEARSARSDRAGAPRRARRSTGRTARSSGTRARARRTARDRCRGGRPRRADAPARARAWPMSASRFA